MLHITFRLAREAGACKDRYRVAAKALGGVHRYGLDTPIPLTVVLEHNGIDDALWALRCVLPEQEAERERLARLFACDCAERVLPIYEKQYPDDSRVHHCIEVARAFAQGQATQQEVAAARAAAWAAGAAADAAWAAGAAEAAAWAAAAARAAAEAAGAAWAAARAAWAAWEAAARAAAGDAAGDAAWAWQSQRFREMLES